LLPYLLRYSSETDGRNIDDPKKLNYCGRWAGDAVVTVGDYDDK
jgi:hypothetical protein